MIKFNVWYLVDCNLHSYFENYSLLVTESVIKFDVWCLVDCNLHSYFENYSLLVTESVIKFDVWCLVDCNLHSYFENFASSFILMWWRHFLVKLPLAWAVKALPLGSSLKSLSLYSHYTLQDNQRGRGFRRRFGCTRIFCNRVFRQIIFRVKV